MATLGFGGLGSVVAGFGAFGNDKLLENTQGYIERFQDNVSFERRELWSAERELKQQRFELSRNLQLDESVLIERQRKIQSEISRLEYNVKSARNGIAYWGSAIAENEGVVRQIRNTRVIGAAAIMIGIGATVVAGALTTMPSVVPRSEQQDVWQAILESGQADIITDLSSFLWTTDHAKHGDVPSVRDLMFHITLLQSELWFGETSDAPEVVKIVKHCWPQKIRGAFEARCESVERLGT